MMDGSVSNQTSALFLSLKKASLAENPCQAQEPLLFKKKKKQTKKRRIILLAWCINIKSQNQKLTYWTRADERFGNWQKE